MKITKNSSVLPFIFYLLSAALLFSCKDPYPGYTKADEGIYYKLLMVGEQDQCCHFGYYVTANIAYVTMDDSIFFSGIRKFKVSKPDFPGSIDKCFTLMCEHDSAQFIISALDFFEKTLENTVPDYLSADGKMKVSINLMDIQTPEEYEREKEAFLHWIEDLGEYEKVLLKQYIRDSEIEIPPMEDGIYYIVQQTGNNDSPVVATGDTVVIHYEGHFLNGKFFDSTRRRNDPLQFVYGQQWQVIGGLEKAIGKMHEGDKALVIIPSEQAFGADGSVEGIVPPFTPVVFEIELISVK
ncbi:MAG: FKBP-type peptidyl-prolyl cis-trans isomerase [Bacteroidales bacterium]|jgi:FKBP-type peptidyl-prolyl cis-trans isomerase|nr:FKBP-type peptidyl-prolyl cis-trans isomerase [Bacteroidales bacterium]